MIERSCWSDVPLEQHFLCIFALTCPCGLYIVAALHFLCSKVLFKMEGLSVSGESSLMLCILGKS